MHTAIRRTIRPALAALIALTFLTGVLYPALVTVIAQVVFPSQANGSFISVDGRTVGSSLIGQTFDDPGYLWGRPSAAGAGHDGMASGGSNLGPTSQALVDRVAVAADRLRATNGDAPIPVDLVTASGSGLDPHISPEAAAYQVARIAATRGISEDAVRAAIARHTDGPLLAFLGQSVVNVLEVNLDLDGLLAP